MTADAFVAHITQRFPQATRAENFGYLFFFHPDDQVMPFVSIAETDNDHDKVSALHRDGVFRLNIGAGKTAFDSLFASTDAPPDFTALNVLMPHPHYAAQHYLCVLNPAGDVLDRTLALIDEAWNTVAARTAARRRNAPAAE